MIQDLAKYEVEASPSSGAPSRYSIPRRALISVEHEALDLDIERRGDGAVLVRIHSRDRSGGRLPDAVFAFRIGDPQYGYWEEQLRLRKPT